MQRKLAIIVGVDYTQPTTTNEESDPRVMGGAYTWKLIEQELPLGPGSGIAELLLQYGTLDHVATGDSHTGAASLGVGYRFVF
jgi:hypothetical protein